ncbi:restriction endonuclease subunit S [Moraxella bovis]|uniref:restriction endonuclease subunit S n=1 Tax=Moraxella bovis TaxID=476 RepID=UPI002225F9F1|nr:restriction endonuclease subunit S [Moraxella bovis]UYZ80742.1 restriction endonuclease subunit S [Moraxella bovis]UZA35887.1 restriction endonuclease subunit S [Moraxella bovis]
MKTNPIMEKLINAGILARHAEAVEWKTLGEVTEVADNLRKPVKAALRVSGDIPYYGANNIQDYVDGYTHNGEYVLIAEDGSASLENYSVQWATGKFWANNHVHVVCGKEELNNRFLFHYLRQMNFIPYLTGSGRAKLTKAKMLEIPIPIPPLEAQRKIVQILDAFTAVTAELTAEHTLRQKQYQYYRDLLLDFDNLNNPFAKGINVEWKSLGDITLKTQNIKWKDNLNSYQYIDLTSVDRENNQIIETIEINANSAPSRAQKVVQKNDVIFATTRPTQMRLTIIPDEFDKQIASTGYCVLRANEGEVLPEWIYFNLKTLGFQTYLENNQSGSAYPAISDKLLKEFQIPLPPLETQTQIVAILDKFDTLIHSISEGLPREIELRQKQYEYYRELLLDFA